MRKIIPFLVGGVALATLAACETQPKANLMPDFGNAVRQNMAAQIINPNGAAGPVEPAPMSGIRADTAITNYDNASQSAAPVTEGVSTSKVK